MNFIKCFSFFTFIYFFDSLLIIFNSQCDYFSSVPLKICDLNNSFINNFSFQWQLIEIRLDSDLYIPETINFEQMQITMR